MKKISRQEVKRIEASDFCTITEYPLGDKDINASIAKINGRYPEKGRVVNTECKELVYVIEGGGKVVVEGEEYGFEKGDVLLIESGEKYYWEGDMEIFMPCTPAWYPEQHEEVD